MSVYVRERERVFVCTMSECMRGVFFVTYSPCTCIPNIRTRIYIHIVHVYTSHERLSINNSVYLSVCLPQTP